MNAHLNLKFVACSVIIVSIAKYCDKLLVVVGPRKFKFPKNHKLRHQYTYHKGKLQFGNVGLRIMNPCCVDSAHFFRLRMLMNRATRKPDKTYRTF